METYRVKQQRKVSIWVDETLIVEAESKEQAKDKALQLEAIDFVDTQFLLETEFDQGEYEILSIEKEYL